MNMKYWLLISACFVVLFSCSNNDDTTGEMQEEMMEDPEVSLEGTLSFTKNLGGSDDDYIVSVVEATDGGYVMAGTTKSSDGDIIDKTGDDRDVWVVKTDANGTILWSKTYGGTDEDEASSIAKTTDGGYIVSGFTRSNDGDITSSNAGFNDLWVLKLSNNGTLLWENTYGYKGNDRAFNIKQLSDGGYLMLGVIDVTASN